MSESYAIETEYNGYAFRSRLEARWAIFLDEADIAYNYESEGFELDGLRYLPDFHLKDGIRFLGEKERLNNVWVEIKPSMTLEERDKKKMSRFVQKTGNRILLVTGDPEPDAEIRLISHAADGSGWASPFVRWIELQDGQIGLLKLDGQAIDTGLGATIEQLTKTDKLMAAYGAARKARFEFGESPGDKNSRNARTCRDCGRIFHPRKEYHLLCSSCYWDEAATKQAEQATAAIVAIERQGEKKRPALPVWAYAGGALVVVVFALFFAGLRALAGGQAPSPPLAAVQESNSAKPLVANGIRPTETATLTKPVSTLRLDKTIAVRTDPADTREPTSTTDPTLTASPTYVTTATPAETRTPVFTAGNTPRVSVSSGSVNLRLGPGTQYEVVDVGLQDDEYEVLGRTADGSWYNVRDGKGVRVWVAASVVTGEVSGILDQVQVAPTIPAPPESTNLPLPTATIIVPTLTLVPTAAPTVTMPPAEITPAQDCTAGYSPCIPPGPDVDCAGGRGNGPRYVQGPVTVTGSDPYDLDRDGDGIGCE